MISQKTIDSVQDVDLVDSLSKYIDLQKNGSNNYKAKCPFHNDNHPSLNINPEKGIWKCFSCGQGGHGAISFVKEFRKVDFPEAVEILARDLNIPFEKESETPEEVEKQKRLEELYNVNNWAKHWFSDQLGQEVNRPIYKYLTNNRKWNKETIEEFSLGYAPDGYDNLKNAALKQGYTEELLLRAGLLSKNKTGKTYDVFRDRIIFPLFNKSSRIVGFTGRVIPKETTDQAQERKYMNTGETEIFKKSEILYGFHIARKHLAKEKNIYLVEGQADVITLHQLGINNTVAISGANLSNDHIEQIKAQSCQYVTLIGDNDNAGKKIVQKAADKIMAGKIFCKILPLPETGDDPDNFFRNKNTDYFNDYSSRHCTYFIYWMAEQYKTLAHDPGQIDGVIKELKKRIDYYEPASRSKFAETISKILDISIQDFDQSPEDEEGTNFSKNKKSNTGKGLLIENYLSEKYEFRFNTIKQKTEYRECGKKTSFIPLDKFKLNSLKRELESNGLNTSRDYIQQLLESEFAQLVDPITQYFNELPSWTGKDHIRELTETVKTNDNERFYVYFRKWIIAVIANALELDGCKNHTCLVLTGTQGKFKTTWIENLCPKSLRNYLYTGKINVESKDTLTLLSEYLFINIDDQLSQINRKDENEIKNLITLNYVKYRRPYDPFITEYPRRASFIGSVNNMEFLTDTTGSRRFLPFFVENIDIEKAIKIDIDSVYSQALHFYKSKERYWFNDDEIAELNRHNEQFTLTSTEQELLQHFFSKPDFESMATHFYSASLLKSKIEEYTKQKLSLKKLGEALTKLGYQRVNRTINGERGWVYPVIQKEGYELEMQSINSASESINVPQYSTVPF